MGMINQGRAGVGLSRTAAMAHGGGTVTLREGSRKTKSRARSACLRFRRVWLEGHINIIPCNNISRSTFDYGVAIRRRNHGVDGSGRFLEVGRPFVIKYFGLGTRRDRRPGRR